MHRDTGACLQIMDGPEKRADDGFSHKLCDRGVKKKLDLCHAMELLSRHAGEEDA